MDYEFVPGRDDFPPDEIDMLRQQLADIRELDNKAFAAWQKERARLNRQLDAALAACKAKDTIIMKVGEIASPYRDGLKFNYIADLSQEALDIKPDASALKAHDIAVFRKGAEYAFEVTGGNEGLTVSDEEVIRELTQQ